MISPKDLRREVIRPTLDYLGLQSAAAEALLLGTYVTESTIRGKTRLRQVGGGSAGALGIFQMEPFTHDDIWQTYLTDRRRILAEKIANLDGAHVTGLHPLIFNLAYATAMCRVRYLRVPAPLPSAADIEGQARYWKDHYNTHQGKGTVAKFLKAVRTHL